jgi:hypothetical protein
VRCRSIASVFEFLTSSVFAKFGDRPEAPRFAKGRMYGTEISGVAWIDLLGYGSMLRPVRFNPSHASAQLAVHRLQKFHSIALQHVNRSLRALIVNDGIAFVREMSPRSRSVTFDFIVRVFAAFQAINAEDQGAGHPGARCIVAAGARLRTDEPMKLNPIKLASILARHRDGAITCEQAIAEAFAYGPIAGASVPLQANFAFTKAYLADVSGSKAGFKGPRFFLDAAFCSIEPSWFDIGKRIQWEVEGMSGEFLELKSIDNVAAGASRHSHLRNAAEIALSLGIDFPGPRIPRSRHSQTILNPN